MSNRTLRAAVAVAKPTTSMGREAGRLHRRAIDGPELGLGIVAAVPNIGDVSARERVRHHLVQVLEVGRDRRTAGVLLVDERADRDVVDPAERLGEFERGHRHGADEPFIAEHDRRRVRPVHVRRHFRRDLETPDEMLRCGTPRA